MLKHLVEITDDIRQLIIRALIMLIQAFHSIYGDHVVQDIKTSLDRRLDPSMPDKCARVSRRYNNVVTQQTITIDLNSTPAGDNLSIDVENKYATKRSVNEMNLNMFKSPDMPEDQVYVTDNTFVEKTGVNVNLSELPRFYCEIDDMLGGKLSIAKRETVQSEIAMAYENTSTPKPTRVRITMTLNNKPKNNTRQLR